MRMNDDDEGESEVDGEYGYVSGRKKGGTDDGQV